jgi:perosamine synthetase
MTLPRDQPKQFSTSITANQQTSWSAQPSEAGAAAPLQPAQVHTFWKGRVGLYALLKAVGVGPGDRVLVPGYTCAMVPAAVVYGGAQPVYVDIEPATCNCSLETIQEAWNRQGGSQIKALILQHTFGIAADVARITNWARSVNLGVIEDCAHAIGSKYRDAEGRWCPVGEGGDGAMFSSQWSKPVSTGLGGWTVTRNPEIAERVRRFHGQHCVSPSFFETSVLAAQVALKELAFRPSLYWPIVSGYRWVTRRGLVDGTVSDRELQGDMPHDFAKRMSGFQQWLLRRRLADLRWPAHRRRLTSVYDEELRRAGIPCLENPEYSEAVLVRYPIRVLNKDEVLEQARRHRVEIGEWFNHPVHPREANRAAFGYRAGMCPEGERAGREVVNLPMHNRISEEEARNVVLFLRQVARW